MCRIRALYLKRPIDMLGLFLEWYMYGVCFLAEIWRLISEGHKISHVLMGAGSVLGYKARNHRIGGHQPQMPSDCSRGKTCIQIACLWQRDTWRCIGCCRATKGYSSITMYRFTPKSLSHSLKLFCLLDRMLPLFQVDWATDVRRLKKVQSSVTFLFWDKSISSFIFMST